MATRMQQRRGTAEQWTLANPVLAAGEIGFETDTNQFKIGDGVNNWTSLLYFVDTSGLSASLEDYIPLTDKGTADGVATLDATGNVPLSQLGNIIDGAPGVLDTLNELAAALNDDASFFTTITTSITSGDSATLTSAQTYADGLAVNYDAAGSAAAAEAAANLYTDNAIAAIPPTDLTGYATETYVDTAVSNILDAAPTALDTLNELAAALNDDPAFFTNISATITNGDAATLAAAELYADGLAVNYDPAGSAAAAQAAAELYADNLAVNYDAAGSAATAETNANSYTDSLIGDGTVDGTAGNTVTDRIASAIAGLVDSAPLTLDTLNELAAALNDDANFATTVTNSLASKAPLASPTFTGTVDFSNATVQGLSIPQPLHPFTMIG